MHYSGPDSPSFSQLNKKALWRHFPQIQTANYMTQVQPKKCIFQYIALYSNKLS